MSDEQVSAIAGVTRDPEEVQRRIDQWAQSFADKAERYRSVQEKTQQIRLSASGANGAVRVTVGADGTVHDLQFSDKIRSMPLEELSSQVLSTIRRAQGGISERVGEVMAETLGDEDAETRAVMLDNLRRQFPPQEEDSDEDDEVDEVQPPPARQPQPTRPAQ